MAKRDWRDFTILQLQKDFNLAGVTEPELNSSWSIDRLVKSIANAVENIDARSSAWENLNYRIDLPQSLDIQSLSIEDISTLFLFRCFQKVWLRRHFSDASSKDVNENSQKDLKH